METEQPQKLPWRQKAWNVFLERLEIKAAIKTGVAAALAWALGVGISGFMHRPDRLVSGMWCTLAAIVVLQARLGGTYKAAWLRFLGVIIGSFFGGLCTTFFGSNPISLGISVFVTIVICTLFNFKESVRIACLSVAVVMILWGLSPEISPWAFAGFRVIDSILGIIVGVTVAYALWPFQATQNMQQNTARILSRLNQLLRFECAPEPASKETIVLKECNRLIEELNPLFNQDSLFLEEAKMELLMKPERLDVWISLQEHLEQLSEFVIALKNVSQHSYRLLDAPLKIQLEQVVDSLDKALQELSQALISGDQVAPLTQLIEVQEKLEGELLRYRNTRSTRTFSLPEVESFFVFFYNIRAVVKKTFKIAKKINMLNQ